MPLRAGATANGRLTAVERDDLTLALEGGGERRIHLGEFASPSLTALLEGAPESARFGLAVLLLSRDESQRALEVLDRLPKHPDAQKLRAGVPGIAPRSK